MQINIIKTKYFCFIFLFLSNFHPHPKTKYSHPTWTSISTIKPNKICSLISFWWMMANYPTNKILITNNDDSACFEMHFALHCTRVQTTHPNALLHTHTRKHARSIDQRCKTRRLSLIKKNKNFTNTTNTPDQTTHTIRIHAITREICVCLCARSDVCRRNKIYSSTTIRCGVLDAVIGVATKRFAAAVATCVIYIWKYL